jgi:4-hydroxy-tetrahydrodipicolinate reductase
MPDPLKLVVSGATGRMGSTIARLVSDDPGVQLLGGIDRDGSEAATAEYPEVCGIEAAAELIQRADALIDFSAPEFLGRLLREQGSVLGGKALVVGTTGLGEDEVGLLEQASAGSPVLTAANFSVAVNLLLALARQAARALGPDYEVEIVEAHHRRKEDAPSGTALALGQAVAEGRGLALDQVRIDGRSGRPGARTRDEIGFHALRGGSIIGEHEVLFIGEMDRVELVHRASDRALFAAGAIRAARWLAGRPAGRYGMSDVLGLE